MKIIKTSLVTALAAALVACGGGGGSGGGDTLIGTPGPTPSPSPSPSPTPTGACSLSERQEWTFNQIDEWYLFPDLIDRGVNRSSFNDLQDYIDALVAPARAQDKDRFFTYITSIEEERQLIEQGSNAGFGVRLGYDTGANRVFIIESFENGSAFAADIDRGDEILAIGTSSGTLRDVSAIMQAEGPRGVSDALGPSEPGVTRVLRVRIDGVDREVTLTKTEYSLDPISDRYGAKILNDNGKRVGYLNLRTFIVSDASRQLRNAFADFKAQGVDEVIVDFRYNGGGLVSVAELMGDLLGGEFAGQVFSRTVFRDSKSANNSVENFTRQSQSIMPSKIAFIGRGGTASASELVINSMIPYFGSNMALIGTDTFGKPVGQIALDRETCDDRLRVVAFKTANADGNGEYFSGLASEVPVTCQAADDISFQLGDAQEDSVAQALGFLAGRSCTPIPTGTQGTRSTRPGKLLLQPDRPNAAQREVPGLF